jgi:hypothetical protein
VVVNFTRRTLAHIDIKGKDPKTGRALQERLDR